MKPQAASEPVTARLHRHIRSNENAEAKIKALTFSSLIRHELSLFAKAAKKILKKFFAWRA